jgi:copper(I)-binding protein
VARLVSVVLTLLCCSVLAGCGQGDDAARKGRINQPVRREAVSKRVGDIRLVLVRIQQPDAVHANGTNAAMFLTLTNDSDKDDTLTAVSSVDAESVLLRDGSAAPEPSISVVVPAHGTVSMQHASGLHLELAGLKRDLPRRHFVPVSFRFETAGAVTFSVFVQGVDHPVVEPVPSATSS